MYSHHNSETQLYCEENQTALERATQVLEDNLQRENDSTRESRSDNSIDLRELRDNIEEANSHKLSYPESLMTALYNNFPTLKEGIDISFKKTANNYKVLNFGDVGIVPGSLCDKFLMCLGDPKIWNMNEGYGLHDCENEVIRMLGKHLEIEKPVGYITSGGTEGNLAGVWWCKRYLTIRCRPYLQQIEN